MGGGGVRGRSQRGHAERGVGAGDEPQAGEGAQRALGALERPGGVRPSSPQESAAAQLGDAARLPYSLKVLFENLLRFEDGRSVTVDHLKALVAWQEERRSDQEIAYRPARVLMQDFTGVPAIVDLAAMREAVTELGGDAQNVNPLAPAELVIDHSVVADLFGTPDAFERNVEPSSGFVMVCSNDALAVFTLAYAFTAASMA